MKTPEIIVLTDEVSTYYLLPRHPFPDRNWDTGMTWSTPDGTLVLHRGTKPFGTADWYRADGGAQPVTATRPGPSTKTGYRLRNPAAASEAYPLIRDSVSDLGDDEATALYDAVYETGDPEALTFGTERMFLVDGHAQPAPVDDLRWVANLGDELKHHPEIHHLFPGHLTGFRDWVMKAIEAQPYMRSSAPGVLHSGAGVMNERDNPNMVTVHRSVPYEPRQTSMVHDDLGRGRRSRRAREAVEAKRLKLSILVPSTIPGANRDDAVRLWNETLTSILAEVEEAMTPAPCWHCRGTGVVSDADVRVGSGA